MKPILETKAPFVIKIYNTFFHISWDGLDDKIEDQYSYTKIRSIRVKRGRLNKAWTVGGLLVDTVFDTSISDIEHDSDELLIEFKTGETETRYLNGESADKIEDAIRLINTKIGNSV